MLNTYLKLNYIVTYVTIQIIVYGFKNVSKKVIYYKVYKSN